MTDYSSVEAKGTGIMEDTTEAPKMRKGARFWSILAALLVSLFLAILETSSMSNILPTIVEDIHGTQFLWIPIAYGLVSSACIPLSGNLAEIFGRRPIMLLALFLFAAGSAIGGAAQNMGMLIGARAIQGAGGGSIFALSNIILSDLVTLQERGTYSGLFGLVWALAGGIGPLIGGAFGKRRLWRWLFYMNVPIAGVTALLVLLVRLPVPPGTFAQKARKIDWIGQILIIGSTSACVIALTWAGITFPWTSAHVLAPLIIGAVGNVLFLAYEAHWGVSPMVPLAIVSNRTSVSGYVQMFLCSFLNANLLYYLPLYFQACRDASPIASGVDTLGFAFTTAPMSIIASASVTASKRYRPQIWVGWAFSVVGCGLLSILRENSSRSLSIGLEALAGIGSGMILQTVLFPILAPLHVTWNAHAISFAIFLRSLAQVWGVVIGGTIIQNRLTTTLPPSFDDHFDNDGGAGIAYAIVPQIPSLPPPLKDEVRTAFAQSLSTLWVALTVISAVGLVTSIPMKGLPLHTQMDKRWVMGDDGEQRSESITLDHFNQSR